MVYLDLILNLALLVALSVISGFIDKRWPRTGRTGILLQGFLFGSVAVIGMLRPLVLGPGLIFDGRTVVLSVCALYFGPWTALVACAMSFIFRASMGGAGLIMGVLTILSSSAIGLGAYYHYKRSLQPPTILFLYGMGLIVHTVMVALMFTLPGHLALTTFERLALPIIILYPLATILAGKILSDQLSSSRAEAVLRDERSRLAYIIEGTNAGTWEWNVQTGKTIFNERWANIIGYTLAEITPVSIETWTKFTHPDDLRVCDELLARHFAGELDYYACEARMRHKDGRWVWVLDRGKVSARTPDGKPLLMQGTHVDITERKQAEEALIMSEKRLKEAQGYAEIGSWEFDVATQNHYWSEEIFRLFEFDPAAGAPPLEKFLEKLHPDDRDRISKGFSRCVAENKPFIDEYRIIRSNGHVYWIAGSSKPFFDDGGKVTRYAGTVQNITERKRAAEALQEAELKFKAIFDFASDGILLARIADKKFILANQKICELLGYTEEELLKLGLSDIHPEAALQDVISQFELQNKKQISIARDIPVMRKDKSLFFAEISSSPIILDGKECLLGFFRDITDRKQAEEEIRQLNKELERRVEERTAELKQTITQLEETNRVFVGRELRMAELKKRIEELEGKT